MYYFSDRAMSTTIGSREVAAVGLVGLPKYVSAVAGLTMLPDGMTTAGLAARSGLALARAPISIETEVDALNIER